MVDIFTENINLALDEVTPFKTFTVKSNYKFGLSNETKILMKRGDATRDKINSGNKRVYFNHSSQESHKSFCHFDTGLKNL